MFETIIRSPKLRSLLIALSLFCAIAIISGCDGEGIWAIDPVEEAADFEAQNQSGSNSSGSEDASTENNDAANDNKVVVQEPVNNVSPTIDETVTKIEDTDTAITIGGNTRPEDETDTPGTDSDSHVHNWETEFTSVTTYQNVEVPKWVCATCNLAISEESGLESHSLTHGTYTAGTVTLPLAELWVVKCDDCDYCSESETDVVQHQQSTGSAGHTCTEQVVDYTPGSTVTRFKCECGYTTDLEAVMVSHANSFGPSITTKQEEWEIVGFACTECGAQFGEDWDSFDAHQEQEEHTGTSTYVIGYETVDVEVCTLCGWHPSDCQCEGEPHEFGTETSETDPTPIYGYGCDSCTFLFYDAQDAQAHEQAFPGEAAHEGYSRVDLNAGRTEDVSGWLCDDCSFFSSDEAEIKAHAATHVTFSYQPETVQTPSGTENVPTGWEYCTDPSCTARREAESP